jgi:hypothetical protein
MRFGTRFFVTGLCALAISIGTASITFADVLEDIVNDFQRLSNEKTPFGVTDGNPQAATAFMSDDAFQHFGLTPTLAMAPNDKNGKRDDLQIGLSGTGGSINTGSLAEWYATTDLNLAWQFSQKVGLDLSLPFEYRDTHGVGTYIGGIDFGLPITIISGEKGDTSWAVTPWGLLAGIGASVKLAQGGYLFGGGVTSNLNHRWGNLTLTLANQIAYNAGFPIAYSSEFKFEQNISQFILKNGVKGVYDFDKHFFGDAGVTYTNFLNGAFTDNYFTVTAGVGLRFGPASWLRVGYVGDADFSNDYYTYGGEVELYFAF